MEPPPTDSDEFLTFYQTGVDPPLALFWKKNIAFFSKNPKNTPKILNLLAVASRHNKRLLASLLRRNWRLLLVLELGAGQAWAANQSMDHLGGYGQVATRQKQPSKLVRCFSSKAHWQPWPGQSMVWSGACSAGCEPPKQLRSQTRLRSSRKQPVQCWGTRRRLPRRILSQRRDFCIK